MKNYNSLVGLSPELRAVLADTGVGASLPPIRGQWFIVDPYKVTESAGGIDGAFTSIATAYAACVDNRGDGILVLGSHPTATYDTSYLKQSLVWAKNGITVIGVAAPTRFAQRARISNKVVTTTSVAVAMAATAKTITRAANSFITDGWEVGMLGKFDASGTNSARTFTVISVSALVITVDTGEVLDETSTSHTLTSYIPNLVSVTGANNSFINLHITHTGAVAQDVNALKVSGVRNYFQNVHAGVGVADANTTVTYSLNIAAGEENTFVSCVFGLDTVDRGGQATYDILLTGTVARNEFHYCRTTRQSTTGTGCLAVYASTTTGGRPTLFQNCVFTIWNTAGGNANCSYMFGSTGSCDFVWFVDCTYPGYAALSNDSVAWISGEINSQAAGLMYT
jgi:hypothetical protein